MPGCTVTIGTGSQAIELEVYKDGYRLGIGEGGRLYISTIYQVDGAKAFQAANALMGVGDYASTGENTLPRPHKHPSTPTIWCLSVDGEWVGSKQPHDTQGMTADLARIVANYGTTSVDPFGEVYAPVFDGDTVPWSSWRSSSAMEILRGETNTLRYETTVLPYPDQDVNVPVPTKEYELVRGMIAATNYPAFKIILDGLEGKVNNAPIFLCDTGTLLLEEWTAQDMRDGNGNLVFEFTVRFRWRQVDHNATLVKNSLNTYERLKTAGGTLVLTHPYASFLPLKTYGVV